VATTEPFNFVAGVLSTYHVRQLGVTQQETKQIYARRGNHAILWFVKWP